MKRQVATEIVDKIIADLSDRRGLRHEWDRIEDDIRAEIRETWINIAENADTSGKND